MPKKVEKKKIEKIINAGRFTPSGGNHQSTHFLLITNPTVLDTLRDLIQEAFQEMEINQGMYSSIADSIRLSKQGNYVFHYAPPIFIITASKKGYGNAMADSACAIENMMLAANALDLGSCYINQLPWLDNHSAIRSYLKSFGLKEDEMICGAVTIGYVPSLNRTWTERIGNPITYIE